MVHTHTSWVKICLFRLNGKSLMQGRSVEWNVVAEVVQSYIRQGIWFESRQEYCLF
jgi:hypothetical protein